MLNLGLPLRRTLGDHLKDNLMGTVGSTIQSTRGSCNGERTEFVITIVESPYRGSG